jgi:hypothetical protein
MSRSDDLSPRDAIAAFKRAAHADLGRHLGAMASSARRATGIDELGAKHPLMLAAGACVAGAAAGALFARLRDAPPAAISPTPVATAGPVVPAAAAPAPSSPWSTLALDAALALFAQWQQQRQQPEPAAPDAAASVQTPLHDLSPVGPIP